MQHIVYARFCEHLVPAGITRQLLPRVLPGRNPFNDANRTSGAIFIHIPKTAGTSVAGALFGGVRAHVPISRYHAYDPELTARLFSFCFVRNPWDRMVSAFHYLRSAIGKRQFFDGRWAEANLATYDGFEDFVLSLESPATRWKVLSYQHFIPQYRWITLPYSNRIAVDFVGRFERLDEDFAAIATRLGKETGLPARRVGAHPDYRDAYSDRSREIVGRLYARDAELLGYRFDGRADA